MNNFKDSIEYNQYQIEETPAESASLQIRPRMGGRGLAAVNVPQHRFENEILPRLSDKDATWLKSKYKLIVLCRSATRTTPYHR